MSDKAGTGLNRAELHRGEPLRDCQARRGPKKNDGRQVD